MVMPLFFEYVARRLATAAARNLGMRRLTVATLLGALLVASGVSAQQKSGKDSVDEELNFFDRRFPPMNLLAFSAPRPWGAQPAPLSTP